MAKSTKEVIQSRIKVQEEKVKEVGELLERMKKISDAETADLEMRYEDAKAKLQEWKEAWDVE